MARRVLIFKRLLDYQAWF